MRANIFSMVDASKRAQGARVKAPSSYLFIFHRRFAVVAAALLLVVFAGGGTAFAAQGALPGTPLYPVKIYVNENVQGALAISPEAQVSFHTSIAETRLKEAQTLASEGKLDATTSAQIESNLNEHVAQATDIAAALEQQDPAAGVEASVNLDSSLAAQGSILARLGNSSHDKATQENSDAIAQRLLARNNNEDTADNNSTSSDSGGGAVVAVNTVAPRIQAMSFAASEESSSTDISAPTPTPHARTVAMTKVAPPSANPGTSTQASTTQKIAAQLQKKAASSLADARQEFTDAQSALDASTTAKVQAQLADLDARMATGATQLSGGDYASARATFTGVIGDSIELTAFIDASQTFKQDFVRSWSGQDNGDQDSNQGWGTQGGDGNSRGGRGDN